MQNKPALPEITRGNKYFHKKKEEFHEVKGFYFHSVYQVGRSWLKAKKESEITRTKFGVYVSLVDDSKKEVNRMPLNNFFKKYAK